MAETYKRLSGKVGNGTIATASTLYTVPSISTVISSVVICNTGTSSGTYSLAISQTTAFGTSGDGGAGIGGYIVYQAPIAANDTIILSLGITLDATNKYLLYSSSAATITFNVFGVEIS